MRSLQLEIGLNLVDAIPFRLIFESGPDCCRHQQWSLLEHSRPQMLRGVCILKKMMLVFRRKDWNECLHWDDRESS